MTNLSKDQLAFLEECQLEFSERFTDADLEFKEVYDKGIPAPPIMYPWYTKMRNQRDFNRGGGDYYNRDRDYNNYQRNSNNYKRDYESSGGYRDRDYEEANERYGNRRYNPY